MTDTEELVRKLRQRTQDHRASRLGRIYSNSDAEIDEHAADTIERLAAPPSKSVEEVCPTCKGLGLTGWDKPIGSPPSMACVPQFCFCEKGRSLAGLNAPDAKRTIVSSISGFEGAPPSATDDEQVMRDMLKSFEPKMYRRDLNLYLYDAHQVYAAMSTYASCVRAEERERCAKIGKKFAEIYWGMRPEKAAESLEAAIRTGDK